MNIYAHFTDLVRHSAAQAAASGVPISPDLLDRVVVEPPREAGHGDLATNAAMVLAKHLGRKPREIAEAIAHRLAADPLIADAEVAGPGFINLTLEQGAWSEVVRAVLRAGEAWGRAEPGSERPVNVEYVSANPTGPLHVGHCRGAVVGDALANLLAFVGHPVTREYYINDAGAQVDVLARSAFLRYREALGEDIGEIPPGLYPGDYLKPVGEALARRHGHTLLDMAEGDWLPMVREAAVAAMMAAVREDLAALNIRHDVFFSERSLTGEVDRVAIAVEALRDKGLIYEGTLPPPKGQPSEDWEDREQTLFRATAFGDDTDRPLLKSDGSYTYFAADIAYHYDKIRRGTDWLIDVLGADHGGYVKRMKAAVTAISGGGAELDVVLCQLVKLFRGGEPVKMSKRSGDFVTLRDVVEEVGVDAVRFMMLFRKSDAPLDFDFAAVTEASRDNPVFYVQYGHARCMSVLGQGRREFPNLDVSPAALAEVDLDKLQDSGERDMIARVAQWPRVVRASALAKEPHRVAFFLHDLASALHAHWNRGKDLPNLRFVKADDADLTRARLALVSAVGVTLRSGLRLLGVSAPDEMR